MGKITIAILGIMGALFCLICAVIVWVTQKSKKDKIIVHMELMVSVLLVMDALAWAFRGYPGSVGYWMVRVSNFFMFILNYSVMVAFGKYIVINVCLGQNTSALKH